MIPHDDAVDEDPVQHSSQLVHAPAGECLGEGAAERCHSRTTHDETEGGVRVDERMVRATRHRERGRELLHVPLEQAPENELGVSHALDSRVGIECHGDLSYPLICASAR